MSSGKALITQIASNTGLPEDTMTKELRHLIDGAGLDSNIVTLDDLRRVLADYAQEILLSAKHAYEQETMKAASGE
jgi:hypothetical protein